MGCNRSIIDPGFAQRMCDAQDKMEREQRSSIKSFLKHEKNVHVRIQLRFILNEMMIETVATSGPDHYFSTFKWLEMVKYNENDKRDKPNCMIEYRRNPLYKKQLFYFINNALNY